MADGAANELVSLLLPFFLLVFLFVMGFVAQK